MIDDQASSDTWTPVGEAAPRVAESVRPGVEVLRPASREEWLGLRMQDVTASDVAAVSGVDPSRSALRVWAEKTGAVPPMEDNTILRRGRWLEAAVIEALRDERPTWELRRAGIYLRDPECRLGATPDAVAIDPARPGIGNVQCKVVSRPVYERDWEDGPPLKMQVQTLAEALLLDAAWAVVAALIVDTYSAELVISEVARHAGAEARIRETVRQFWADLASGRQPRADYRQDGDLISQIHAVAKPGKVISLKGDNALPILLAERAELKARASEAEARSKEIDAEIKAKMGDAEIGDLDGWRVTWKTAHRKERLLPAADIRVLRVTQKQA